MNRKHFAFYLFLTTIVLSPLTVQSPAVAADPSQQSDLPLLQLVGGASVASKPNSMIIRCEGYHCRRYHELVYWGFDNKIYFLNAHTLIPAAAPLSTSSTISTISNERYLFYDRYYQQIYALDKFDRGSYPNRWDRLAVQIIRGYKVADSVPVNEEFNRHTPVDRYYPIDGAVLQQPFVNPGAVAEIFIDNPVNGTVDLVNFHGHYPETAWAQRFIYRTPLTCAAQLTCSWHENPGSSLAVDAADTVYLADNNDFMDRITVLQPGGGTKPDLDHVGSLFDCFVGEAGISMAPDENVLYLPAGCQSFAKGGLAQLDTTDSRDHRVIDLPYYDQGLIVDWSDQKRVFAATTDFDGTYDPERRLYLHLIYDGQLIATLPVTANYERGSLSAMAFDPFTNMLYLAVDTTIYKVQVNYGGSAGFPPLPAGEQVITPAMAGDLIARDYSAFFHFGVGAVNGNTRVSYRELPPTGAPGSELLSLVSAGTGLYTMRQFELTAVSSDTNTPLNGFNFDYQLKLYYSPKELGPVTGGSSSVQLYQWDGAGWQRAGSTYAGSSNMLTIYANSTGLFAVMGPTNRIYLPAVWK